MERERVKRRPMLWDTGDYVREAYGCTSESIMDLCIYFAFVLRLKPQVWYAVIELVNLLLCCIWYVYNL